MISRTSVMRYKGLDTPVPEIARELNVDAVLEGSALLIGDRVRVSVHSLGALRRTLWADRYDRELDDVFALQSELAETVARRDRDAAHAGRTAAVEARAGESGGASRVLEGQALLLRRDRSARSSSGCGMCVARSSSTRIWRSRGRHWPTVSRSARCAECHRRPRLRRSDGGSKRALASTHRWPTHTRRLDSFACSPATPQRYCVRLTSDRAQSGPRVRAQHARAHAGVAFERHAEALEAANMSVQLDPLSTLIRTGVGDAYYFAREYEKSVFHYRMSIELDPRFDGAHTDLARALECWAGSTRRARPMRRDGGSSGGVAGPTFGLAHLEAASGNVGEARRLLAELTEARSKRVVVARGESVRCTPASATSMTLLPGSRSRCARARPGCYAPSCASAARPDPAGCALLAAR